MDPSGAAGEHLVEPVDLDHVQGWPSAPAAPSTWCRRFVRHSRRAVGGAVDLDHAQGMAIGAGGAVDLVY